MASEIHINSDFGHYSGGRRPALKPQQMLPADPDDPAITHEPRRLARAPITHRPEPAIHEVPRSPDGLGETHVSAKYRSSGVAPRPFIDGRGTPPLPERKEPTVATVTASINAPCGTCIHERICIRKPKLAALGHAIEAHRPVDVEGVTFVLEARIECDAFMDAFMRLSEPLPERPPVEPTAIRNPLAVRFDRAVAVVEDLSEAQEPETSEAPRAKRGGEWTPERRARMAESMRQRNAAAGGNVRRAAMAREA